MKEPNLNPPTDHWESVKEQVMDKHIRAICQDVALAGSSTRFKDIYNAVYEIMEEDIREAFEEGEIHE